MATTQQFIIYLRREQTTDSFLNRSNLSKDERKALSKKHDVVAYTSLTDMENGKEIVRWHWYMNNKPTKRKKTLSLDCYTYKVYWMPEKK